MELNTQQGEQFQWAVGYGGGRVRPNATVRLRRGVYTGMWGRVLKVDGRRVTVRVPGDPPQQVTLDAGSMEVSSAQRD